MRGPVLRLPIGLLLFTLAASAAQVEMRTERWANNDEAFAGCNERIVAGNPRNLLARKPVRCTSNGGLNVGSLRFLTDGYAGSRGDDGRAFVNGQPSVITFYLGEPKPIHEVGLFTCNIDARANQDFEIRFASSAAAPGKEPAFPDKPHFTSGDKVIGPDAGGFHSWFVAEGGGPILSQKMDWVQFRIWRTYNVKAGTPARTTDPQSASVYVELEVYSAPDDVIQLSAEEIARRKAIREAPKRPTWEKQTTWQETMLAARKAIVEWEILHDRLAIPDLGADFGPWHARALDPQSKEARAIDGQRKLDLGAWTRLDGLRDGDIADLARLTQAKPGQIVFLCRTLEAHQQFDRRNPLTLGTGLGEGWLRLLPQRRTISGRGKPFSINQQSWDLSIGPGQYQLLARIPVAADGTARLWFLPQPAASNPGAGAVRTRIARRERVFDQLLRDFAEDAVAVRRMQWERADSIWITFRRHQMARIEKLLTDWLPGEPTFLAEQYQNAVALRAANLRDALTVAAPLVRAKVEPRLATFTTAPEPGDYKAARGRYYALATVQEAVAECHAAESLRLAVADQQDTFGDCYPKGDAYMARVAGLRKRAGAILYRALRGEADALAQTLALRQDREAAAQEILLANPLLEGQKLLLVRGGPGLASNWGGANRLGNELVALSPIRPDGEATTLFKIPSGSFSNFDLSFDAKRILFSNGRHLFEVGADGKGLRQITHQTDPHVHHYDPCYLPDGHIMFVSTACEQAVPCTGQWYVGNMHLIDAAGKGERRLAFDQDHNWNPCMLGNGRVIYTRWEYTDTPHYFDRLLFHMNPDGTEQMEFYGSNSYWPNAMYWPRPIPGRPTQIVCIVSGHHGVARQGEMVILDPARGRHEADGVVQRIGDRGKTVEPVIKDGLVREVWPRFVTPYPLAEPGTHRGAGRYFLATVRMDEWAPWGLYLVDVFDNMTPVMMGGYSMPTLFRPRPRPPIVPSKVDLARKDAVVYMASVYEGAGLRGYPQGSIKALRIGTTTATAATATPGPRPTKAAGTSRGSSAPCPSTPTAPPTSACPPTPPSSSSRSMPRARPSSSCEAGSSACRARSSRASAATSGRTPCRPTASPRRSRTRPPTSRPGMGWPEASASTARSSPCSTAAAPAATTASRSPTSAPSASTRASAANTAPRTWLSPATSAARATRPTTTSPRPPSSRPTPARSSRYSRRATTTSSSPPRSGGGSTPGSTSTSPIPPTGARAIARPRTSRSPAASSIRSSMPTSPTATRSYCPCRRSRSSSGRSPSRRRPHPSRSRAGR